MARNFSNTAIQTTLASAVTAAATSITVSAVTGFPVADFVLAIDADAPTQELVLVTAIAGTTLTVTRGYDNTTAVAHDAGAVVRHSHAAIDFREAHTHVNATAAHGATGAVVGTTNVQTLTGKTVNLASNTITGTLEQFNAACSNADFASTQGIETLTGKTVNLALNTLVTTTAQLNTALSDNDIATLAGAETLTNKTVALGSNTVSGTKAQFDAAMTDGDFASLAGSEALTNKDLTSSTNTFPVALVRQVGYNTKGTDTVVTSEGLVLTVTYDAVTSGLYRVLAYFQASSDTASAFTTAMLREDSVSTGITGAEFTNCITDHRLANRREGVTMMGRFVASATGVRYVKLTASGGGGTSTIKGFTEAPVFITVERIA